MEPLGKILEIKKSKKRFLENILHRTDPYTRKKYAKLRPFMDYDRTERERLNKEYQRLEKEIAELEGLLRHIYRRDSRANALNVQKGFGAVKKTDRIRLKNDPSADT